MDEMKANETVRTYLGQKILGEKRRNATTYELAEAVGIVGSGKRYTQWSVTMKPNNASSDAWQCPLTNFFSYEEIEDIFKIWRDVR